MIKFEIPKNGKQEEAGEIPVLAFELPSSDHLNNDKNFEFELPNNTAEITELKKERDEILKRIDRRKEIQKRIAEIKGEIFEEDIIEEEAENNPAYDPYEFDLTPETTVNADEINLDENIDLDEDKRAKVSLKEILSSVENKKEEMSLPIGLGKTVDHRDFIMDLSKSLNIMIAGGVGKGKPEIMNSILSSLITTNNPSELKLVLVDQKKVEFSKYNQLSQDYMAFQNKEGENIISNKEEVVETLHKLLSEMDNRYGLLKETRSRNIKEYNEKIQKGEITGKESMAKIVLAIDEIAELMTDKGKEFEAPITRLAQLSRAVGIYTIIATQRPSVNILTGPIKANFITKIATKTMDEVDSRKILEKNGAENLIGNGDFILQTDSNEIRIQAPNISEEEIKEIIESKNKELGESVSKNLKVEGSTETPKEEISVDEKKEKDRVSLEKYSPIYFGVYGKNGFETGPGYTKQESDEKAVFKVTRINETEAKLEVNDNPGAQKFAIDNFQILMPKLSTYYELPDPKKHVKIISNGGTLTLENGAWKIKTPMNITFADNNGRIANNPTETPKEEKGGVSEDKKERLRMLREELDNPEVDIETYFKANSTITEAGKPDAIERKDNETIGKKQAKGSFLYFMGKISPKKLLTNGSNDMSGSWVNEFGFSTNPTLTEESLAEIAERETRAYLPLFNKIKEEYSDVFEELDK